MKKYILLLMLAMGVNSAMAKSLLLTLKNGSKVYYLLGGEKNPVMTFEDGKICVNADGYEITDIKNFIISKEDDPNAIQEVRKEKNHEQKGNILSITTDSADKVQVFSLNGKEMSVEKGGDNEHVTVNLEGLPKGVYIIRVADTSFKISKK